MGTMIPCICSWYRYVKRLPVVLRWRRRQRRHTDAITALAATTDGRLPGVSDVGSLRMQDTRGAAAGDSRASKASFKIRVTGLTSVPDTILALLDGRLAPGAYECVRLWQLPTQ